MRSWAIHSWMMKGGRPPYPEVRIEAIPSSGNGELTLPSKGMELAVSLESSVPPGKLTVLPIGGGGPPPGPGRTSSPPSAQGLSQLPRDLSTDFSPRLKSMLGARTRSGEGQGPG